MSVAPAVLLDGTCVVPLKLKDSGGNIVWQLGVAGDLIVKVAASGLVLKSANGHYWRVTVDNTGSLLSADLGTSPPT